jgi:hypothetical protein
MPSIRCSPRAGGEATVKVCGVAVVMLPGQSWVPAWSIDSQ